jgi:hypothetical protein
MKRAAWLFAIALPAFADRFTVTYQGKPVAGAEVCATRAGDLASPVTRFLTGGTPLCSPAKDEVRLPPGQWNVWARSGTELMSDTAIVADGKPHELVVKEVARYQLPVARPATGNGQLATHVYVVSTGVILPITDAVPATRVVPLIVVAGEIRAIGTPVVADKPVRFEFPPDAEGKGSVVVPVSPISSADVTLAGAKQRADSALLFFRGVPAGAQQVAFAGVQKAVKVEAGKVAVADPIVARPKLRIHWWTLMTLTARATLELLDCPARCNVVGTAMLPAGEVKGVVELPGVRPGNYRVRVTHPGLPPFTANIDIPPDDVNLEIRYIVFSGKVTRGGEPLHVRLFDTVTDPKTGEYTAVVAALPKPPITLQPVEGGRTITVVPDAAPVENARYDIDVPDNRLTIRVVDADSRAPVESASVTMAVLEEGKDEAAHLSGPAGMTDADGRLVIDSAVANKRLQICAKRNDYENACADRFRLGSDAEKTIEIALSKATIRHGRVVLPGPQQFASIAWYSPDGRLTETAQVKEDGTFDFQRTHLPGEIVTYASANQPFIALRQPPLGAGDVFEIRPAPGARVRGFQVSAGQPAFFTIALGDMIVPQNAFAAHLGRHGAQPSLQPGWASNVPDIVESAPIRVILIPFSFVESHDARGVDVAMHPEANALPQQALGERTRVEFR